jgi:hypothetical protein
MARITTALPSTIVAMPLASTAPAHGVLPSSTAAIADLNT